MQWNGFRNGKRRVKNLKYCKAHLKEEQRDKQQISKPVGDGQSGRNPSNVTCADILEQCQSKLHEPPRVLRPKQTETIKEYAKKIRDLEQKIVTMSEQLSARDRYRTQLRNQTRRLSGLLDSISAEKSELVAKFEEEFVSLQEDFGIQKDNIICDYESQIEQHELHLLEQLNIEQAQNERRLVHLERHQEKMSKLQSRLSAARKQCATALQDQAKLACQLANVEAQVPPKVRKRKSISSEVRIVVQFALYFFFGSSVLMYQQ